MDEVWNQKDSSYSWPACQTEQLEEKGLGQGGDQEPDGHSNRALEFLCGDERNPLELLNHEKQDSLV
jgi:hypothetical protein